MTDNDVHIHRPSRTGVELGTIIAVIGMLAGLIFNAGIQYDRQITTESRVSKLEGEYGTMHDSQLEERGTTNTRLGNIETLLHVMKDQQDKMQSSIDGERKP